MIDKTNQKREAIVAAQAPKPKNQGYRELRRGYTQWKGVLGRFREAKKQRRGQAQINGSYTMFDQF